MRNKIAGSVNNLGYVKIKLNGKSYAAHRLAFLYVTGSWPENQVDHINRIRTDNRWENLRKASNAENMLNTVLHKNNISGVPGITWDKILKMWRVNYRTKYYGVFKRLKDAKIKRKQLEEEDGYKGFRF